MGRNAHSMLVLMTKCTGEVLSLMQDNATPFEVRLNLIESVKFTRNSDYDEPFVEVEPVLAQDEPTEEKFCSSS